MLSIIAGIMIGIGCIIYLSIGGIAGALLFSMGLLTILVLKMELFTGKAGLLTTNEISFGKLFEIWIGNFLGTFCLALGLLCTPKGEELATQASQIVAIRLENGFIINLIYGIICGLLMFMAVKTWQLTEKPIYAIMPVAIFILSGFNHCVADMFYCHLGCISLVDYQVLIPTTIGNILGCNIIPLAFKYQ